MNRSDWVWMPHAGHFICSRYCQFHLCTWVGGHVVSTVGEYLPDEGVREIIATSRDVAIVGRGDARRADYMEKIGFEDIGYQRKYETMVFPSAKIDDGECCPYRPINWGELDCQGYNDPADAFRGHVAMCEKWAVDSAITVGREVIQ